MITTTKRPNQFTHPWTEEEIVFISNNMGKLSYKQMGKFVDRTPESIQSKVRYLPFQQKVKKYPINHNFFSKWSSTMAYILGFIAADGNICKHGNAHMLQLASDDKDVIVKIKRAMNSNKPIHERPRENGKVSYQFRVSDPTIFYDLLNLGITPRKSLTLRPQKVPRKYLGHYLRGFFDGDGCIHVNKKSGLNFIWYTSSLPMAQFLHNITKSICPKFNGKLQSRPIKNGYFYNITLGTRDSKIMFKYLYKGANIYMKRKYHKFLQGLNENQLL